MLKKGKKGTNNCTIREVAQRLADIEFGDFGTLGGNCESAGLVEFVLSSKGADRLLFTELYLSELRLRLLSDDFSTTTEYKKETCGEFNPRL